MRFLYVILFLVCSVGISKAQFQNYELKTTDTDTKSYIGRDFVRLLPGYSYKAEAGKSMNALVRKTLTTKEATNLYSINPIYKNSDGTPVTDPSSVDKSKVVGSIPISSSVSSGGAKCYSVPIDVLPGRQGFQPQISLNYNSQAGNGVMGMGWSIGGVSSITRVPTNVYYDGFIRDINYIDDRFSLDGNRLIEINRTSSQINYETSQGNIRVIGYFNSYNQFFSLTNISYFKVLYPNGTIGIFGSTSNETQNLEYPITSLTDLNGSVINYTYLPFDSKVGNVVDNEIYYIDEINYGGNGTNSNFAKVKFNYDLVRPDYIWKFQSDKSLAIEKRLISIQIASTSVASAYKSYTVEYNNNDSRFTDKTNDVSKVAIIRCAVNGSEMNPLKFYCGDNVIPNETAQVTQIVGESFDANNVNLLRCKLGRQIGDEAVITYNKGLSFAQGTTINYGIYDDYGNHPDMPGAVSYVYPSTNTINLFKNLRNSTANKISLGEVGDGFIGVCTGDFYGVKHDNIIKINSTNLHSSGSSFIETIVFSEYSITSNTVSQTNQFALDFEAGWYDDYQNEWEQIMSPSIIPKSYLVGDFTGDGKAELLMLPISQDGIYQSYFLTLINVSQKKIIYSGNSGPVSNNANILKAIDVDGDGQTEIIAVCSDKTYIYKYNSTSGFALFSTWPLSLSDYEDHQIMFADLNGDNKIDIITSPASQKINTTTINGPAWFNQTLHVTDNYFRHECGYIQRRGCRNLWNGTGQVCIPSPYIVRENNGVITDASKSQTIDPDNDAVFAGGLIYYNASQIPPDAANLYPRYITSTNTVESYCPGCFAKISYPLPDWDKNHCCWSCNLELHKWLWDSKKHCSIHKFAEDGSTWHRYVNTTQTFNRWVYQYTNGKDIVFTQVLDGYSRWNSYKFSILELNGDDVPDLIVQDKSGNTAVVSFDLNKHSFTQENARGLTKLPANYEFVEYSDGSNHKTTSLLALGSNTLKFYDFTENRTFNSLVTTMVNSVGVVDLTSYEQLQPNETYTLGSAAQFPYSDYSGPTWVVKNNSVLLKKQLISNVSYHYNGAIMHNQGLGLIGFTSVQKNDLFRNKSSLTEYNPYQLGTVKREVSDVAEATYSYDYNVAANKKITLNLLTKTEIDKLKGNSATTTYSGYNAYGFPTTIVSDYGGGIKTTVVNGTDNSDLPNLRLIGLPRSKTVTSELNGKTTTSSETWDYYTNFKLQLHKTYIENNLLGKTEYFYDPTNGMLENEVATNPKTNDVLNTDYTYWPDDNCSLKTKTDPMGFTTTYNYEFSQNSPKYRLLNGITDHLGNSVTYSYDDWRRKTKEVRSDGVTTDILLNWGENATINSLISQQQTTTGSPTVKVYSDALGREVRSEMQGFDGNPIYTDKVYDNFGRLQASTLPYKGGSPLWTNYSYDEFDRPTSVVAPSGSSSSWQYAGNSVTQNVDGVVTTKTSNAIGQLISSTDQGGTVQYNYRPDGQPETITANGAVTTMEYNDPYNRQTKLIDPSAGSITTNYDDVNRQITQTWNSGKTIKSTMDQYGRPTQQVTPDFTTTYGYDPITGDIDSIFSTNGTSKGFKYDPKGRLWKSYEKVDEKSFGATYGYLNGQLNQVVYSPLNYTVNYNYSNGYLRTLTDATGKVLREVKTQNPLGQETQVAFGNGTTTTTQFTPEGLCSNVKTVNASSSTWQDMSYDFNRINGTLNSRSDNRRAGLTESFSYGSLYRLEQYGAANNRQTVSYLPSGNIQTKTDVGNYQYADAAKPYTLSTIQNYTSAVSKPIDDITYTIMSRPTSLTSGTNNVTFKYNDDYSRVFERITNNGAETLSKYYLADGQYEVATEGGVEKQRLYLDGSPYNASIVVEKVGAQTKLYYLHRDYLGSITQISDENGNLAAEYSYDAWGRMRNVDTWQAYAPGSEPSLLFGRGYTGHEHIPQLGLINMNARLYDPVLGRFLAPDPQVASPLESNGYNRYMYADNNPLMFVDINGEADAPKWVAPWNNTWNAPWNNPQISPNVSGPSIPGSFSPGMGQGPSTPFFQWGIGGGGTSYGDGYGSLLVGAFNWLFGSKPDQSRFKTNITTYETDASRALAQKNNITLSRPSNGGISSSYSGGQKRVVVGVSNPFYRGVVERNPGLEDASFLSPVFDAIADLTASGLEKTGLSYETSHKVAGYSILAASIYFASPRSSSRIAAKGGWKVGEPITNLTAKGNVPAWSTVRQRFWKNEAFLNASEYDAFNIPRMQRGLAPQRLNPNTGLLESMELHHHIVPQRNGGLFDFIKVWPDEHRALDPFRR